VDTLFVPDVTINSDQGNKFVLVVATVGTTNMVQIRPVAVGRLNGTLRAITAGLTAEDRVIVNGQMMMMPRPGTPVEIATPAVATKN